MGQLTDEFLEVFARAAGEQGGIISGDNPTHYSPSNPIRLWILQISIIICFTQILVFFLSKIRQPRVIAEVIGGILLGPTVMGRIPNFRDTIFPTDSMPLLTITSTVGLILFLFLVGLEVDVRVLKRNMITSTSVSVAGLVLPLGLGAALGVGVYREYIQPETPEVNFGHFLLFTAVAVGITAFPVLCRIVTELQLLDTEVGLITLAAAVCDDVVGWILLALTVALVNASGGLVGLWVLLATAGYVIFILFPGKWALRWLLRRTGSLEKGAPTHLAMTVILLTVFVSAFFTDIIGVHAIFGGFIIGLIVPHDNGLAISIVEKIEELVTILFIPIYFTLSGLRTNLGLLDTGKDWGYIVLICLIAFTSKFCGCAAVAYYNKFNWREAGAIGSLMSCKGLVELIVLNIGLQAGILTPRAFSMFVVHALVLTFMTTPLVLFFYPPKYRKHHRGDATLEPPTSPQPNDEGAQKTRFSVVLDRIETLPAAMTISQLLHPSSSVSSVSIVSNEKARITPGISIEALRLVELTNRTSAVLRSQEADALIYNDPVVSVFRTFGQLNRFNVSSNLSVVKYDEFPEAVSRHARTTGSQMVIVPWPRGTTSVLEASEENPHGGTRNPFDGIFHKTTTEDQTSSFIYSEYVRKVFQNSSTDVALFVDRGSNAAAAFDAKQHLFLPFFGGPDDRLALNFLVQVCQDKEISATVVRIKRTEGGKTSTEVPNPATVNNTIAAADTVYGQQTPESRLASDTADNVLWDKLVKSHSNKSNINFSEDSTPTPLRHLLDIAKEEVAESVATAGKPLIIFAGRSRRLAVESLENELKLLGSEAGNAISSSVPRTVGEVGAGVVAASISASLLIFQAAVASTSTATA